MGQMIQVYLGERRAVVHVDGQGGDYRHDDRVIVEVERGSEFAQVGHRPGPEEKCVSSGRIIRKALDSDLRQIENNRTKAKDALHVCIGKVNELKLEMNVLSSEYAFDGSKIIFNFTAEGRVDFRELVKELAKIFRARIELKQVGVRDRAKMVGGHGVCGRTLCCNSFIREFGHLSFKMAKEQALPLNPSKISGMCGRVKCCMAYEYQVYREFNRGLPKMGSRIETAEGQGKVINLNILKRLVHVDMGEGKVIKMNIPVKEASAEHVAP